ncbi:MAG: universal stress protein [Solirubrobacteraceae bacterium]
MGDTGGNVSVSSVSVAPKRAFGRALCAIDGKPGGYEAVRQAASLVRPGGDLTLLLVTAFRTGGEMRAPEIGPTEAHEILKRAAAIALEAGARPRTEVDPAAPPERVVLEWAADHDLLAIGAPSTSWLSGLLASGVADCALGELPTPLLTARPGDATHLPDHILVASDGLDDSSMPVTLAGQIAVEHGSKVTVLHAVGHGRGSGEEVLHKQTDYLREQGVVEPDLMLIHGHAHEVIVDVAARFTPSLVVLGSRRRHGPRTLGSVSRRVIHEVGCSVLTVPPEAVAR